MRRDGHCALCPLLFIIAAPLPRALYVTCVCVFLLHIVENKGPGLGRRCCAVSLMMLWRGR